jgi:four helix bundle protein
MEEHNKQHKYDLEERLIRFAVDVTEIVECLPETKTCNHLGGQLIRSSTSPALNYGEAQGAESRKDFSHKMAIILKEIRESRNNLKILMMKKVVADHEAIGKAFDEAEQLSRIMRKSIQTAEENLKKVKSN